MKDHRCFRIPMRLAVAALLLVSVVPTLSSTARAAQVVVTFDDLVGQTTVSDGYGGINWDGKWTHYDWEQNPYTAKSAFQRIYAETPGETKFSFVAPDQTFDGAWFAGDDVVFFRLYNDGMLVHTSTSLSLTNIPGFLSSGYNGPVDAVGVVGRDQYWVMDDVTYTNKSTVVETPEPASGVLVGLGALGLWMRSRTRRKSVC